MVPLHDPQVVLEFGTDVFVSVFPAPVQVGPVDGLQVAVAVKIEIQIIMGEFVCVTFLFPHVNIFSTSVDRATTKGVREGGVYVIPMRLSFRYEMKTLYRFYTNPFYGATRSVLFYNEIFKTKRAMNEQSYNIGMCKFVPYWNEHMIVGQISTATRGNSNQCDSFVIPT